MDSLTMVEPAESGDVPRCAACGVGYVANGQDRCPTCIEHEWTTEDFAQSREEMVEYVSGSLLRDQVFANRTFVPPRLGTMAEHDGGLRLGPDGGLWRYREGVYRPDGDEWLAQYVRMALGEQFRENHLREVRSFCRTNTSAKLPTEPTTEYINVANGLLYWREDPPRLVPHDPDVPSIIQLPVAWDEDARCPEFINYLETVLPEGCLSFVSEWTGYLLVPTAMMQRALMLEGPGDTGKSTLLKAWEALLGPSNVANHTLQAICDERFVTADLYGRLANVCADLDARAIKSSGRFKVVVAGDSVTAEKKFKDHFSYRPHSRLIFSANEAPGTPDQSDAYYKRWLILPMHNKVATEDQDPTLPDRLTSPEELSGILRFAVTGLRNLMDRGAFEVPQAMSRATIEYRQKTDTVVAFVSSECALVPDARVRRGVLYDAYKEWCRNNGKQPIASTRFKDHLQGVYQDQLRATIRDGYPEWKGIELAQSPM